jgi:hypothetical protein
LSVHHFRIEIDFSDRRRSEIEAARRAGKLPKKITVRKRTTIEDLLDDWSKSAEFKALSAASQSSYRKSISAILYRPQTREAAAKMRAEIRAAKLLGVAEPVRELEAIATARGSWSGVCASKCEGSTPGVIILNCSTDLAA